MLRLLTGSLEKRIDDPAFRHRLLDIVPSEIRRLDSILEGLLDYARPIKPVRVPTDLASLLRTSAALAREEAAGRNVTLEESFEEGLPPMVVDGEAVKQVFLNLVRNGLDAAEGSGERRVSIRLARAEGGAQAIEVSDSGPGIDAKTRDRIFHPFFSTKTNGTGLGLAVCRKIVEAHGGKISADSAPGRGAVFTVILPPEEVPAAGGGSGKRGES
jgi:signal transduction histidine kinase